jgi:outer membrane protein OmpA-like peptidoglycan-associated protein
MEHSNWTTFKVYEADMTIKVLTSVSLVSVLVLGACTDPAAFGGGGGGTFADGSNRTRDGAIIGGVIGAVTGAVVGDSDEERRRGAAIGAVVGAGAGAVVGNLLDKQAAELEQNLDGRVGIVNTGNELIVTMPQDLLFAVDSASLRPDLQSDLRVLASSLNQYPNTTVEVIGHTDNTGEASYNQDLSQRRAQSVSGILLGAGVTPGRVRAYGRGEDAPIASNLTPDGRAQNRRVAIIIRPTS